MGLVCDCEVLDDVRGGDPHSIWRKKVVKNGENCVKICNFALGN